MNVKLIYLFINFLIFSAFPILGVDSKFEHPLRIEPASVYSKIRVDGSIAEGRQQNTYQKDKNLSFEGEFKFLEYFSVKGGGGKTWYQATDTQPINQWDRWNLGLKFATETGGRDGRLVFGGGVRIFNRQIGEHPRFDIAPDLYLVRPQLSFGFGVGDFEMIFDGSFQTETNSRFREGPKEEFRRHYQGGLSISQKISESIRIFVETEYREPYHKRIDQNTRGWYWYPGISIAPYDGGRITASFQFPVSKEEHLYDRGLRLSFFHFFE